MRRPFHLSPPLPGRQQGFALFIVLMIMIVIALLVIASTQSYNTEQRISSNDADRKFAMSLSEAALRAGENAVAGKDFTSESKTHAFTDNCDSGLCAAVGSSTPDSSAGLNITVANSSNEQAWLRTCAKGPCIDTMGLEYNASGVSTKPRYIIEFIKVDTSTGALIFRVTAKAWGKNANTVVMTQSYITYD